MTVLILVYRLRKRSIVNILPDIGARNISLITIIIMPWGTPPQDCASFRKVVVAALSSLFARGEEVGDPKDDILRNVICADPYLMVDEVKSFFEVEKNHPHSSPITARFDITIDHKVLSQLGKDRYKWNLCQVLVYVAKRSLLRNKGNVGVFPGLGWSNLLLRAIESPSSALQLRC